MTNDELEEIEARANAEGKSWAQGQEIDPGVVYRDIPKLVQEVRDMRLLVQMIQDSKCRRCGQRVRERDASPATDGKLTGVHVAPSADVEQ